MEPLGIEFPAFQNVTSLGLGDKHSIVILETQSIVYPISQLVNSYDCEWSK